MTDNVTPNVSTPAPSVSPTATPSTSAIASTPAPAPVVSTPAPSVTETPVSTPAADSTPVESVQAPEAPKPVITPLGAPDPEAPVEEEPAPEAKAEGADGQQPAEGDAKPEGEKKDQASQSEEPAPLPTYDPFKIPEGLQADESALQDLGKTLGEFENLIKSGKYDHDIVQNFGQQLVDRHIAHVQKVVQQYQEAQFNAWENQKQSWFESFKSDPEIGGNRMETTTNAARQFIRNHGGNAKQQQEFRDLMNTSGVGNHPAMIRLLAKANTAMSEGKPLPASTPVSDKKGKAQTLYGGR